MRQPQTQQARQTEPIDASLPRRHIAHEVQQIEILVALSLRTAQAGFREAQRLEQHSFLNYDELTADQRHKTAPYPRTCPNNREPSAVRPYGAEAVPVWRSRSTSQKVGNPLSAWLTHFCTRPPSQVLPRVERVVVEHFCHENLLPWWQDCWVPRESRE